MSVTGWLGEEPDAVTPVLPVTEQLLRNRERGPGDTLAIALARGRAVEARELREEAALAPDPDERAANMVGRGLAPGMVSQLGQRLADAEAELQAENEKIAKGERVTERVRGMLERRDVGALEASRMMDGDFGDAQRAAQLERRAGRLRQQLAEAQAMVSPAQERELDPVAEAGRHAHQVFAEVTRAKMAAARDGRPEPRPFGSASRGGVAVRSEQCVHCMDQGVDPETSFLLHSDPERNVPVTTTAQLAVPRDPDWETERTVRSAGAVPSGTLMREPREHWPVRYDTYAREIAR